MKVQRFVCKIYICRTPTKFI
ncbi:hypothetical protein BDFB_001103 [Asbolus verrucosus]|uniref:Uncharacterized protein n=1 Tax=Asbolus verrucosus TaxID=1661398 RepID=A0A482VYP7_ASBVE|nr:hypothetical protein BDFB_001103 [Asbolus verrucosus]